MEVIRRRSRRTLSEFDFENYPAPSEIYATIVESKGWPYKVQDPRYQIRDRALVSTLYLGALRVSEALRLRKRQFSFDDADKVVVKSVLVSKRQYAKSKSNLRSVWLPKSGERARFTGLVMDWLELVPEGENDRLFPFGRTRAWQIVEAMTGKWNHYFRALGEAYLYDRWGADILAVADYVNVTPGILAQYIRGAHRNKAPV
jgi:integrase